MKWKIRKGHSKNFNIWIVGLIQKDNRANRREESSKKQWEKKIPRTEGHGFSIKKLIWVSRARNEKGQIPKHIIVGVVGQGKEEKPVGAGKQKQNQPQTDYIKES